MSEPSVDPRAVLGATPFFADILSPAELDRLAEGAEVVAFAEGATLVIEDEPGSSMFVIVSGTAEVTLHGDQGPRHLADLGPSDIVGEGSARRRRSFATGSSGTRAIATESAVTSGNQSQVGSSPRRAPDSRNGYSTKECSR